MSEKTGDQSTGRPRGKLKPWFNLFLLVTTLFTIWTAGAISFPGSILTESALNGLIYMGSLAAILLFHEMGHYVMARRNNVEVSLPYFIPIPPAISLFGTLGAVIIMKGRIRSRNALMEVGAAGPIAGAVVAALLLIVGLVLSPVEPIPESGLMEGQSLLYMLLKRIAVGKIPQGHDVILHPAAWAGWVGLLVTMLNLIPIGQLDGGHIFYAMWGEAHKTASRLFHAGLFALGVSIVAVSAANAFELGLEGEQLFAEVLPGANWIFLGVVLLLFALFSKRGLSHPPTDDADLSRAHFAVGVVCVALFVCTFTPVPLRLIV